MWEKPVLLPPRVSDVSQQALLQALCVHMAECVGECTRVGEFFVWV